jgi:hypothetical protein
MRTNPTLLWRGTTWNTPAKGRNLPANRPVDSNPTVSATQFAILVCDPKFEIGQSCSSTALIAGAVAVLIVVGFFPFFQGASRDRRAIVLHQIVDEWRAHLISKLG